MRLARKRQWARWVLRAERWGPALAPAGAVLLGFVGLAWVGGLRFAPPALGCVVLAGALGGAAWLGWTRGRTVRRVTAAEVDRRLEQGAGDVHRALLTLADRPADGVEGAVWRAHRNRAAARLALLRVGPPRLGARGGVGLVVAGAVLVVCAAVGGGRGAGRLGQALTPWWAWQSGPAVALNAWIVPPRATGLGPVFLRVGDAAPVAVPVGSALTVTVAGGARAPRLRYGGGVRAFGVLQPGSFQAGLTLVAGGVLEVRQGGTVLARWRLAVAPDRAPVIAFTGAARQRGTELAVPWSARDDYGLASVTVALQLAGRPDRAVVRLMQRLAELPRMASGAALPDLTAHPWAGLPVLLTMEARDGGGQVGRSATVAVTLPERAFANPLARALIDVRRGLVLAPERRDAAVAGLDRLAAAAAPRFTAGQWLNQRAIAAGLARPGGAGQAVTRLWQLASAIEDAGEADARQRLADVRAALRDALAAPGSAAQQARIAALSAQLQRAMQRLEQALAAQNGAAQPGEKQPADQAPTSVDAGQLQRMAQQMADAAQAGRLAEAQTRLQQLGDLLDRLRAGSGRPGRQQAGNPEVAGLQQAERALRSRAGQRLDQAAQSGAGAQQQQDAAAQAGLRARLGALAEAMGAQGQAVPDGLAHADAAMHEAQQALARGDDAGARAAQLRALEGLQAGGDQAGAGAGRAQAQAGPGTDPLGRPQEGGQAVDDGSVTLPAGGDPARGRALRDELRRRAADRTRAPAELEYLDRLLDGS